MPQTDSSPSQRSFQRWSRSDKAGTVVCFGWMGLILLIIAIVALEWHASVHNPDAFGLQCLASCRWLVISAAGWALISLIPCLLWGFQWPEKEYHHLIVHFGFLEPGQPLEIEQMIFLCLGILPGYLVALVLTDPL